MRFWYNWLLNYHAGLSLILCTIILLKRSLLYRRNPLLLRPDLLMTFDPTRILQIIDRCYILHQILLLHLIKLTDRYLPLRTLLSRTLRTLQYSLRTLFLLFLQPFWNLSRQVVQSLPVFINIIVDFLWFLLVEWFLLELVLGLLIEHTEFFFDLELFFFFINFSVLPWEINVNLGFLLFNLLILFLQVTSA